MKSNGHFSLARSFVGLRRRDAVSVKFRFRQVERRRGLVALALVAPLLVFLLFTFVVPLGGIIWRSVDDRAVGETMPRTVAALHDWDGHGLPDEDAYRALVADLRDLRASSDVATPATRLNYDLDGFRTLMFGTARNLPTDAADTKAALIAINPKWGETEYWGTIKHAAGPVDVFYLLSALDLRQLADGAIVHRPADESIYVTIYLRTFETCLFITLICLLLGFPLAYHLAVLPARISNLLMILVLLPFWTSMLVRTSAWVVLLQDHGLVNEGLGKLGLVDHPVQLIYNRIGVYIAMVHILLPFMVLPLYSVMRGISPTHMRAAASLGAAPFRAFVRVYLPQCTPGIASGSLLVFILALGYYIAPALVGGGADSMISYFIAFYVKQTTNWGMAAALGVVLLLTTLALYTIYSCVGPMKSLAWGGGGGGAASGGSSNRVGRTQSVVLWITTTLVLGYLVLPIVAIVPLSFNAGGFLVYPLAGVSLRWYQTFLTSPDWLSAIENSLIVASATTVIATVLGTLAALGFSHARFPFRGIVLGLVISPIIVPVVVLAVGFYFFFAPLGLTHSYLGLILAHTTLATPLVVIIVSAALSGFDRTLMRASAILGANPVRTFFVVVLPLVLPGVISGALFAFSTSLDEIVTAIFLAGPDQMTLPLQMLSSVSEYITPTITAVATLLIAISIALLVATELLRRRGERLRGVRG